MNDKHIIKIYGERHTGTKYLNLLVVINLQARVLSGTEDLSRWYFRGAKEGSWYFELASEIYFSLNFKKNLGWKHILVPPPHVFERSLVQTETLLFLTITKNPYSWLLSLYRNPWHAKQQYSNFDEFLVTPWQTIQREHSPKFYINPMDMWNKKNAAYLELKNSKWNTVNLTYEALVANPELSIDQIATTHSIQKKHDNLVNRIKSTTRFSNGKNFFDYQKYYLEEEWKHLLTADHIKTANKYLDENVMQAFGYKKI